MKDLENKKELNELEVEKVAGGLIEDLPEPYSVPVDPPEPEPGPMGRQASEGENQKAALNLHFNWGM